MIKLADRMTLVKPSPTLAVAAKATALRAAGKDIISLSTGEPDFDTPIHVKQAAIDAIQSGFTKYTAVDGIPDLKEAIIHKFKRDNGLDYTLQQILVSVGGKQSFYNLCQAYLNPGDEVIVPAPYWVSYPDIILLAGAKPIILSTTTATRFKMTPEQLKEAITNKTRLVVLNSPSNPTGVAYTWEELKAIGDILADYPDILIATDDMYEHIMWSGPFVNILDAKPELYKRTVVLNGVSKAYAMTGWRIGYAGGPEPLIQKMKVVQSQSTSNPCSIAQKAAVAALNGPQDVVQSMVKAFQERHDYLVHALAKIDLMTVTPADGTFYLFPNIEPAVQALGFKDDVEFAEALLEKTGLAVVPGQAFGAPMCIRLSFATDQQSLEGAVQRLSSFMKKKLDHGTDSI